MLCEGAPADIVVYDFDNLAVLPMEVAHDFPGGEWRRVQRAHGYRWVLVNGAITIEDDCETATYGGELLRHGGVGARRRGYLTITAEGGEPTPLVTLMGAAAKKNS